MVHKVGAESKFGIEKMISSNHKAGIHQVDTLNGAKSWLDEMDMALSEKEQEMEKLNKEIDKWHELKEAEQIKWEKEHELSETKAELAEEKDKLAWQREEIHDLQKKILEQQVEAGVRPQQPMIIPTAEPMVAPEVMIQRPPPTKPITEEIKEAMPKVKERLVSAGKFIEKIPKILFPEKKKKDEWEKFKKESKIKWVKT